MPLPWKSISWKMAAELNRVSSDGKRLVVFRWVMLNLTVKTFYSNQKGSKTQAIGIKRGVGHEQ